MQRLGHGRLLAISLCVVALHLASDVRGEEAVSKLAAPLAEVGWAKTKPADGPFVETPRGFMVPYKLAIPGTDVDFEMVPIPGGKFRLGSPDGEPERNANEGPQVEIDVPPAWIGKYEVTWSEYQVFMNLYEVFKEFARLRSELGSGDSPEKRKLAEQLRKYDILRTRVEANVEAVDAVTAPTRLYDPSMTYQYGDDPRQPAVTMTQYAAKHYTKWLSKITGHYYRLPSEAEWEYACRAGTTTAYSFGDDASQLDDYAWHTENSDSELHKVGGKKPNPWGLYDMHGNVAEWVLDELFEKGYADLAGKTRTAAEAIAWPKQLFPRVLRGGHWDSSPAECRSAARMGSGDERDWKAEDPNRPLSPWWFTTEPSHGVGFRLIRPVGTPTADELAKVWEADLEDLKYDIADRLKARGAEDKVDLGLPEAIRQLKALQEE